jgi:ABC-type nitrate/sulfonate/bicarbonate transport system ATPase subunit
MLAERPLLLLDEPFGALDALNRLALQTWLLDVWSREQRSVLLVTHDIDEAIFLADRVLVFSARPGHIIHSETISLPRPRQRRMLTTDPFYTHRTHLAQALGLLGTPAGAA